MSQTTQVILDEHNTLEFEVLIQGVSTKGLKSRLIVEVDGYDLAFDGEYKDNSVIINIPIMAQVIEPNTYKATLEFITAGHHFEPVQTDLEFILPSKIEASIKNATSYNKAKPIDAGKITIDVKEDIKVESSVEPVVEEDAELRLLEELKLNMEAEEQKEKMRDSIKHLSAEIERKDGRQLEIKNLSLEVKDLHDDGTFSGYGSVFGVVDSYSDVVVKGAFKRTIRNNKNIKLLWQHDTREPIGIFTTIKEDEHGLYVEGKLAMDVQRGREAFSLMKMDAVNGLSIGFSTLVEEYDAKQAVRFLKEIKLYEISVVTFPANADSLINNVKNTDKTDMINNSIQSLLSDDSVDHATKAASGDHSSNTVLDGENESDHESLKQFLSTIKKGK